MKLCRSNSTKIFKFLELNKLNWSFAGSVDILKPGRSVLKPELLFAKIEDAEIEKQIEKLQATLIENSKLESDKIEIPPMKDTISYDDFMKMDIRIGKILTAEKVEKSNKLLKMLVDTGLDKRTIVSGIAKHFTPEEIIGKQVSVLMNLAPRKIMGVESQGMILLAEDYDGSLVFVTPDSDVVNGSGVS